jgi:CheY-like chemotaxis protein
MGASVFCVKTHARRLAQQLHGDLHVRDRTDGLRGADFALRIPLREAPPAFTVHVHAAPAADHKDTDDLAWRRSQLQGPPSSGGPPPRGLVVPLRASVLVVDDSADNRRLARRMLQQMGCAVTEAGDGDEVPGALAAAAAAGGAPVGVVLMDIEMRRVGGCAALRAARGAGLDIPIIAMTGDASEADAAACEPPARFVLQLPAAPCTRPSLSYAGIVSRCRAGVQRSAAEALLEGAAAARAAGGWRASQHSLILLLPGWACAC